LKQELDKLDSIESDVTSVHHMTIQQQHQRQQQHHHQLGQQNYRRHIQQGIDLSGSGEMFQHSDMGMSECENEWKIHEGNYRQRS